MRPLLIGTSLLALVAACAPDPLRPGFRDEAGRAADDGGFGNATMNNALVQSGARGFAESLSRRFAESVPTTINFAFGSAALDGEAQRTLAAQAAFIRSFPEVRFAVYGHTDLVGSASSNYDLGLRRARAAVAFLVAQGVDGGRLEALVSEGETRPLIQTQAPSRENRRTVTDVTGFVDAHPNVLNGRYAEVIFRGYVASAVPAPGLSAGEGAGAAAGAGAAEE